MTAIQKYERENSTDFLKYVGFLFTMTDGFKNLDGLVKSKVRKEVIFIFFCSYFSFFVFQDQAKYCDKHHAIQEDGHAEACIPHAVR